MIGFSTLTGKLKKRADDTGQAKKEKDKETFSDHSVKASVSRSTTLVSSISIGAEPVVPTTKPLASHFKDAELSGRLELRGSGLHEFPSELFDNVDMLDLVFLDVSENQIFKFPNEIQLLDCLKTLLVRDNKLILFPQPICTLEQLSYLDLSFNKLAEVPNELFQLPLKTLILAGNRITTIPKSINEAAGTLNWLDYSSNDLTFLPTYIRHLKELRVLNVSNNKIDEIPAEICSMQLRMLDLTDNRITVLPRELVQMQQLQTILLQRNRLEHPPPEVSEKGVAYLFKWLLNCKTVSTARTLPRTPSSYKTSIDLKTITYKQDSKPQEISEPKTTIVTDVVRVARHPSIRNVQIVNNGSAPENGNITRNGETPTGKENIRTTPVHVASCADDAANNNSHRATNTNLSNGTAVRKPTSRVAPMIKGPTKLNTVSASQMKSTGVKKHLSSPQPVSKVSAVPKATNGTGATSRVAPVKDRKSEEMKKPVITTTATRIASKTNSEIDAARKLLRDKLGVTYAVNRGEAAFGAQLSDGSDLCRFLNKIHPDAVNIATSADFPLVTNRSKTNVERFLQYCKRSGVPESEMCSATDILNRRNTAKLAHTVLSVSKLQAN
ncbi:unnamed protein product [Caenorhabditis auriculariae]|uniref:Calponin-homology (CH) domain-containing protein n=1 Tax=Caenorhabditis auriculariae TaxID=2777116 RepID=A0A8S1H2C9_9PELO|nr:unnamed protein product [Caenorhabditis auriculariae]